MRLRRPRFGKLWFLTSVLVGAGCAAKAPSAGEMADPIAEWAQPPSAAQPDRPRPYEAYDPAAEWARAQRDLAGLSPPVTGNPYAISMDQFVIEIEEEPFVCGKTGLHAFLLVYGCFVAEPQGSGLGVIRHVRDHGALRHEARHAILFVLGDSRWPDVGH